MTHKKVQIYNILDDLRLSFQKGKSIHPESDGREAQVEAVKTLGRTRSWERDRITGRGQPLQHGHDVLGEASGAVLRKDGKFRKAIRLFACYQMSLGKRLKDLESFVWHDIQVHL